ncbi:MAG: glycosyltransferase [Candidatus Kapaibacteriales bacterium]
MTNESYQQDDSIEFIELDADGGRVAVKWAKFYKDALAKLSDNKYDIAIAADLYSLPIIAKLRKDDRASYSIYDSREIYSSLGSLEKRPISQRVLQYIENRSIKYIDHLVASGLDDIDYLKGIFQWEKPTTLIKNLPPKTELKKTDELRQSLGIEGSSLIAVYQGAIVKGRGIGLSIEAISSLESWVLVIIGGGPDLDYYIDKATGCDNIFFTGSVPYDRLLNLTASADLGLCIIEPITLSYRYALPNKLFEYMMAGLPVLSSDMPQMEKTVKESNCGLTLEWPIAASDIVDALNNLSKNDGELLNKYTQFSREASKHYSYESQLGNIAEMLNQAG